MADWLARLQHGNGGFAMIAGQEPDVWATYYAARLFHEIVRAKIPAQAELLTWLRSLQLPDGGLTWCPGHRQSDVRAVYYAVNALKALQQRPDLPWQGHELLKWMQSRQAETGAFCFHANAAPCMWATFRATSALRALGWSPAEPEACREWILGQLTPEGFTRWEGSAQSDVWANFSAVGALAALDSKLEAAQADVVRRSVIRTSVPSGGLNYRPIALASDALTTASAVMIACINSPRHPSIETLCEWLQTAHTPWEGGVMYMPGRGAEVRCSLWAVSALRLAGRRLREEGRLVEWIRELQNPDGGFGYWVGRGSDMTSSMSAVAILTSLGRDANNEIDHRSLTGFVMRCLRPDGAAATPRGLSSGSATAQASYILHSLGQRDLAEKTANCLGELSIMSGFRETRASLPSLYATYQALLAYGQNDRLPMSSSSLDRFLAKLVSKTGEIGWTPLQQSGQDPLAVALFTLLKRKADDPAFSLPVLALTA
ncbi:MULTISPECIES: prenyltransferase/squalene oxidase repeat-containing protein [unclassified Bradyrhizobium]|nr:MULTISPECIES: prenyltransferase/squalene oxidase repeat-containing protein [unclassified Bradyrhizobium]